MTGAPAPAAATFPWRRPLGARPVAGGVEFRVWAPRAETVAVRVEGRDHALADEGHGVRAGVIEVGEGADYAFVLDGGEPLPDPSTRWQPDGLRGPSRVLDTGGFSWTDGEWHGHRPEDLVLYELHVGTFSAEGTFDGAIPHLPALRELGITAIELMPVADFPGDRGWGYDGVYISAAHRAYGGPAGLQRLVDAAHAEGLGVVLDVVYNHVGASGQKALEAFGPYFTDRYSTFWGDAMNYDDAECDPVREWVLQSAEGWVRDFHVDGLRLDACHAIFDMGALHILSELRERTHPRAADRRVGHERPQGHPAPGDRRLGPRRPVGRRLPPRAAHAADRRARGLLRGVRRAGRPGQGAATALRPRRDVVGVPRGAASGHPRSTVPPTSSSSSPRTTTRSVTARSATGHPRRSARCSRS